MMKMCIAAGYLACIVIAVELLAPYTKVEESFNMQAMHDLFFLRGSTGSYDHHTFPGVVPRTFSGAVLICGLLDPFLPLLSIFGCEPWVLQHLCRLTLGAFFLFSVYLLSRCLPLPSQRGFFFLMVASQFHTVYYATRFLPNTFATIGVNIAFFFYYCNQHSRAFFVLGVVSAVFRSDVLVLIAPLSLISVFWEKHISLQRGMVVGALSLFSSLAVTVPLDSYLWGRLLWPEGNVFLYNTFQNESQKWGVLPFHWYFTTAIPKALLCQVPILLVAVVKSHFGRSAVFAVVSFLTCYSFLPHKELRFVMIVFPSLMCPAAYWCGTLRGKYSKIIVFILLLQSGYSWTATMVSRENYPGAAALNFVHSISGCSPQSNQVNVFVDDFAAMTGVSRFLKRRSSAKCHWQYVKDPLLFNRSADTYSQHFDYVIVRSEDVGWLEGKGVYRVVESFGEVLQVRLPLEVVKKEFVTVMKRSIA